MFNWFRAPSPLKLACLQLEESQRSLMKSRLAAAHADADVQRHQRSVEELKAMIAAMREEA